MRRVFAGVVAVGMVAVVGLEAQQQRQQSPEGTASTQVNGRWIDIVHGKPILRGRTGIFGSGADYGRRSSMAARSGAPAQTSQRGYATRSRSRSVASVSRRGSW